MYIINDRTWFNVSAVICVCGTNFCTLWGDTRRTTNVDGKWIIENDKTQKVFKLNDRVVYGVTGVFDRSETLLTPIESIKDIQHAKLTDVRDAIVEYLNTKRDAIVDLPSNFVVGGRDSSGVFCVYEIRFNTSTREVDVTARRPTIFKNFATTIMLPKKAESFLDYYFDQINTAVNSCRTHKELVAKVAKMTASVADLDDTVNRDITVVTVK